MDESARKAPLSLKQLLIPAPESLLVIQPVSPLVNSVKNEGPELPKKRATKKRSGKQPVKQPAKRKRQQSVNQADKPTTDADKTVEAAQQLVAFKKFAVARQKAAKAVPYNSCVWEI